MVLLMWKWIGLFMRKNHLLRCWRRCLSPLNLIRVLKLSLLLKLPPRKLELWFILYCCQYCCHVWGGTPCCYLELLDKLRKRMCGTVGPSLAASLEHLDHRHCSQWKSFSIGIIFADVHLNWLNWFHYLILMGGLLIFWYIAWLFCYHF